jgi:hypothetical protein
VKDYLVNFILFAILAVLVIVTTLYAREAQSEAMVVRNKLNSLNITAQNRCMVRVVLSYPPPISEQQYDLVLSDFDRCVSERP